MPNSVQASSCEGSVFEVPSTPCIRWTKPGAEELRPSDVVKAVEARIPFRFTTDDFQRAWKALGVRPLVPAPPRGLDLTWCSIVAVNRTGAFIRSASCRCES